MRLSEQWRSSSGRPFGETRRRNSLEQSGEAARIAKEIAAVENDAAQKKQLEQFVKQQEKEESAANQIVAEAVQTIADAASRNLPIAQPR